MLFSASIFIPVKPNGFNLTRSEKICWYSLAGLLIYGFPFLLLENYYAYRFPQWVYYPTLLAFLINFSSYFIRSTEFENLNGYFEGTISFNEEFLTVNEVDYKYSELENLMIYGNSFSGEKTENYRYGPMYGNGVKNLISFTYNEYKIEKHFQLNSERHLDELQNTLIHIITQEKIPFKKEHLDFINEEHRSYILFEFLIGKLIEKKKINYREGLSFVKFNSNKDVQEFKAKYCN
ncbi:hypothetical protein [Flavobacterium sp. GSB-24]|uniref:hypothetical protein n=1 Tax=Flavobacterium sp. GSB-24 TaxID=2994319 RepID=UPI0024933BE5|nr:hypothetical protein [Flavobacterium sp. GSB-24]BDU23912.1 hypothetical protein FLGSB24_06560 [Flavobacterium sp. GSB-24]